MIFQYFSRQISFSRTFQECLLNSNTFQACANHVTPLEELDWGSSLHIILIKSVRYNERYFEKSYLESRVFPKQFLCS